MGVRGISVRIGAAALAASVGAGLMVALTPAAAGATAPVAAVVVTKAAAATCSTGKYQKQVEGYLKQLGGFGSVSVDGKQSSADCAAIKKFQSRYGLKPVAGLAGREPR